MEFSRVDLERKILKKFKHRGWSINTAAKDGLLSALSKEDEPDDKLDEVISEIKDRMNKHKIRSSVISVEVMQEVCAALSTDGDDLHHDKFKLEDAFSQHRISYDSNQKSYQLAPPSYALHGDIEARAEMYRERIHLATQRALRQGARIGGMSQRRTKNGQDGDEITTIESLLGDNGSEVRILLGLLTQPEEGKWHLEDMTSNVWLDFSNLHSGQRQQRLFTEGCVVMVTGQVSQRNSNRFAVMQMIMLPVEARTDTLKAMNLVDPFDSRVSPQEFVEKYRQERSDSNVSIIILSDCCFASATVCENLRIIFENYEKTDIELLFVLMGPFTNKDFLSTGGREAAEAAFSAFGETLNECPKLRESSRFLLIPSCKDPGTKASWPRRPIPEKLVEALQKRGIKKLVFASNPCRVLFWNQEIVFFREDLLKKMQRHALQFPTAVANNEDDENAQGNEGFSLQEQFVQTILAQAHLYPLPPTIKPITWELDYTMRLHPLPTLLVLADHSAHYEYEVKGCKVVNPGSFSADTSFIVYSPSDKVVEPSGLNG
eukprot:GSChrysophyteH1.ASY1.ANO1.2477.1 assembled CDS